MKRLKLFSEPQSQSSIEQKECKPCSRDKKTSPHLEVGKTPSWIKIHPSNTMIMTILLHVTSSSTKSNSIHGTVISATSYVHGRVYSSPHKDTLWPKRQKCTVPCRTHFDWWLWQAVITTLLTISTSSHYCSHGFSWVSSRQCSRDVA